MEDFDPVRIRPFVKVGDDTEPADSSADSSADAEGTPEPGPLKDGDEPPLPGGSTGGTPALLDLDERPPVDSDPGGQRRRRRAVSAAGVGVAAVAVLVTGGIIGGLFSYDGPSRDGSGPEDIRANLPEAAPGQEASSSSASPSGTASSASPSGNPSTSPAATPTESRTTPTGSATPTRTPSNSGSTATAAPAPTPSDSQDPVLGTGDSGPEVTELQLRLRQIGFYNGVIDGDYDPEVESAVRGYQLTRVVVEDESGVYGPATRTSLESETTEP